MFSKKTFSLLMQRKNKGISADKIYEVVQNIFPRVLTDKLRCKSLKRLWLFAELQRA
jgi:hypothetical protein